MTDEHACNLTDHLREQARDQAGDSGNAQQRIEWRAADEIERLRAEVAEWTEEAFIAGAHLEDKGDKAGWYSTNALRSVMSAGDRLVELGLYEKHPDGVGRVWWYRPIPREASEAAAKEKQ